MGPKYIFQLIFSEKLQNANNLTNAMLEKKICTDLEYFEFYKHFDVCLTIKKTIQFCSIKVARNFY
jgi:hypothetical protein